MITCNVDLKERAYNIYIGNHNIDILKDVLKGLNQKQKTVVIITEKNVAELYLDSIKKILSDYHVKTLILPSGEATKSFTYFEQATRFCLQHNVERNHAIIALGGGVIGDLTGFVASTIRRGCKFIQIPTTLLSQVDSSVGGKTAINTPEGKNLIGTFYQPSAVIIDIQFLKSLPKRIYRSGYAEVIKYGLLGDREFFDYLKAHNDLFLARDINFLTKIIAHSVKMKADIVLRDETEQGERALLNLGHSFGHAYEAETGFSDILHHGEAVAIGMLNAAEFSCLLGFFPQYDVDNVKELLLQVGFNMNIRDFIPNFSADIIVKHIMQDKKVIDDAITLILLNKIGSAFIKKNINSNNIKYYLN